MKKRILTGALILIGVVLAFLSRLLTPYVFDALIAICSIIACYEVSQLYNKNGKNVNMPIVVTMPIISLLITIIGVLNKRPFSFYLIMFIVMFVFLFLLTYLYGIFSRNQTLKEMHANRITYGDNKYSFLKALRTSSIFIYPNMFFACFYFINHFADFASIVNKYGVKVGDLEAINIGLFVTFALIFVFVCTMLTDTFAMLFGMLFKGPKLCPKISPKKTISGAISGLVISVIGTMLLFLIFNTNQLFYDIYSRANFSILGLVIFGIIGSIISQIGDIFASFLKRKAGIKDFGNILPGHGGIMDRMDGICFNALFTFIFLCVIF